MNFPQPGYQPQQGYGAPQQGYPPQQQGYGPPQGQQQQVFPGQQGQQAPPRPQGATQSVEEFFSNPGGSGSGPSFDFTPATPSVAGKIVDMVARQKTQPDGTLKFDKNGNPSMQLIVTLQTDLRGWAAAKATSIPEDPTTKQKLGPEFDDGKRRIYVWYTMREAVEAALAAAGAAAPEVGGQLAVRVTGTKPNEMGGSAIRLYEAFYKAPVAADAGADAFFGGGQAPAAAPQPQYQQPAAPQQQYQAPAPQQGPPPAQQGWGPPAPQGPPPAAPAPQGPPPAAPWGQGDPPF